MSVGHSCPTEQESSSAPALPGFLQWPEAMSSLTVARQRGTCTRFPVLVCANYVSLTRTRERIESITNVHGAAGGCQFRDVESE